MRTKLVAEIGNNHLGNMTIAKKMIQQAKESGADMVKGQAYSPCDFQGGSMPINFYQMCHLSPWDHLDLSNFASSIGIEYFVSYFSFSQFALLKYFKTHKFSASIIKMFFSAGIILDGNNLILSVNNELRKLPEPGNLRDCVLLAATPYVEKEEDNKYDTSLLERLKVKYNVPIGYSDHNFGVDICLRLAQEHYVCMIEKHFVLEEMKNNIRFAGQTFRDCQHAATPKEFEQLARGIK